MLRVSLLLVMGLNIHSVFADNLLGSQEIFYSEAIVNSFPGAEMYLDENCWVSMNGNLTPVNHLGQWEIINLPAPPSFSGLRGGNVRQEAIDEQLERERNANTHTTRVTCWRDEEFVFGGNIIYKELISGDYLNISHFHQEDIRSVPLALHFATHTLYSVPFCSAHANLPGWLPGFQHITLPLSHLRLPLRLSVFGDRLPVKSLCRSSDVMS